MPPYVEQALRLELGGSSFLTLRGPSRRANLSHRVVMKGNLTQMENTVQEMVIAKARNLDNQERMIVFTMSKQEAKSVKGLLVDQVSCGLYTGDLTTEEKVFNWQDGGMAQTR